METGVIEGVTEVIESTTEAICDRSALPDGTALENGRYEIRTTLGNGGFGITYKAWDYRLRRYVAIKEFFPDGFAYRDAGQSREVRCIQDAQTFQHGKHRFQKEAQLLAKLDFSHIVRVHDSFEENNTVYIVMEYINGETLNRYVRRTGPIAASYLRELFLPLLRDLDAIHRTGLIHRDISPDNIMVTAEDGQLKLIDFGTAKDLTPTGEKSRSYSVSQSVVRMNYSPIEMFSTVEKKPSADVYSLCATMYFCLTGEEPPSALDRAFDDTLPSGLNALDRSMSRVILKGLSLKPEARYASAEELMQALDRRTGARKPQKGLLTLGCAAALIALALVSVLLFRGSGDALEPAPGPIILQGEPAAEDEPEQPTEESEQTDDTKKTDDSEPADTAELLEEGEPSANQVAELEEPAVRARFVFRGKEKPESWEPAIKELEKRLDMLHVQYVIGQEDIDSGNIFVELPQSETAFETLYLLIANRESIFVGGSSKWNTNDCTYTVLPDGGICATVRDPSDTKLRSGFKELRSGRADSQMAYLFISLGGYKGKILRAELTVYPENGKIEFRDLLLQNADGTWDDAGFMELLGYIAEDGATDDPLCDFMISEIHSEVTSLYGRRNSYAVSVMEEDQAIPASTSAVESSAEPLLKDDAG